MFFAFISSLVFFVNSHTMRLYELLQNIVSFCLGMLCCYNAFSQTDSMTLNSAGKQPGIFSKAVGIQHGFIFAHSEAVQNTSGANPTGAEISLAWQRNDSATWVLCNCYPRKGLLISYYDFDTKILGKGFTAAYFLEPTYRVGKNIFFSFIGSAGLSWLTNPFDSISNSTNQSYSQYLNGYLRVGIGLWFRLNDQWWMQSSANYHHESNGGMKNPNKGINWPTAGIALSYQKKYRHFYSGNRHTEKYWKNRSLRWDAGIFGVPRRATDENGNRIHKLLLGTNIQAAKQVGHINTLTIGTELYHDAELRLRLKRDSLDASAWKAGILFGHEFLLGKFIFSQRLGYSVMDQTPYYDKLYHRWGLQYSISQNIGVGLNLQAHRQVADYVDVRLTYSMKK